MVQPAIRAKTVLALANMGLSRLLLPAMLVAVFLWAQVLPSSQAAGQASLPRQIAGASQDIKESIKLQGRQRSYLVHLPPAYEGRTRLPLVIVLHGGGGNYRFAIKMTGMSAKADKESFVVVYPNGSGYFGRFVRTWNAGDCCGYAKRRAIDDAAFLSTLIDKISFEYAVDRDRVFLTGFSNGAMMAYQAACRLPDKLAAIAVVGGSMTGREARPDCPLSVIILHGTADRHVPYEGGRGKLAKWGYPVNEKPVAYAVEFWAGLNGLSKQPQRVERGNVVCQAYTGGKAGSSVVLFTIAGAGHAWPGGRRAWFGADKPSRELCATDVIWHFFACKNSNMQAAALMEAGMGAGKRAAGKAVNRTAGAEPIQPRELVSGL